MKHMNTLFASKVRLIDHKKTIYNLTNFAQEFHNSYAGLNETHFDIVASHFRDTMIELGAAPELISEALGILLTARPYFMRKPEHEVHSDNDSSGHGGAENVAVVAGRVQELLLSSDAEVNKNKEVVRKLTQQVKPATLERLRSALRMRGPGLVELLDQVLEGKAA